MYGATKLYAILAMRVCLFSHTLQYCRLEKEHRLAWALSAWLPDANVWSAELLLQTSQWLSRARPCLAQELQKRAQAAGVNGVEFFAAHPGIAKTGIFERMEADWTKPLSTILVRSKCWRHTLSSIDKHRSYC